MGIDLGGHGIRMDFSLYDPFGQNRMLYTVQNFVAEDTQIVYNDGVKKLFLYTGGELGGNENLKNLLHYFSKSDEENVVDPELLQLHSIVESARSNQKVGEQYMTLQDYIDCEVAEGVEKGIAEAVDAAVADGIRISVAMLKELNVAEEQIVEKVMEKYNISIEEAKAYVN